MTKLKWHNEQRLVKELIPYEHNPRKLTKDQHDQLTKSLKKFDMVETPVINLDNKLIVGHMRLKVMAELGMTNDLIDVRVPNRQLTPKEHEEYLIRSNKNTGEFDFDILGNVFDKDELVEWGFNEIELGLMTLGEDGFDESSVTDDGKPPRVKLGELWALGEHRLLCGDSTKVEDWEILMKGEKAQLVFTDAPYSVNYKSASGNSYSKGKYSEKFKNSNAIFSDDKEGQEAIDFYTDVLTNLYKFSEDSACLYWWFAQNLRDLENRIAWINTDWQVSQVIVWLKEQMVFSMGADYHRCFEPCLFGWKKGKSHFTNRKIANYKDVFSLTDEEFSQLPDLWYERRDKTTEYVHPTQKPIRLAERALNKNSKPGDIVIDAFSGSASTIMACEQAGRKCRAMELDPKYVEAGLIRWAKFTGKDPIRVSDGKKWSEVNPPEKAGEKLVNG